MNVALTGYVMQDRSKDRQRCCWGRGDRDPKNRRALWPAEHQVYGDCATYVSTSRYELLVSRAKTSVSPLLTRQLMVTLTCISKLERYRG
jgi:hypothetical protein